MKKRIVFITDCSDIAYSELRGTTLSELERLGKADKIEIEPVIKVEPFSILHGSFSLRLAAESYPDGTIFSVILNPAKIRPERIFGKTIKKSFTFIGANTGVFDWFLKDFGLSELYELSDPGFISFGGKYIHAPAAARLATGVPFKKLGNKVSSEILKNFEIKKGVIIHIDNFGLMKFYDKLPELTEGQKISVSVAGRKINAIYSNRMMSRNDGEWIVYTGSSFGLNELGLVRMDGAREIAAKIGDIVTLEI